MRDIVLPATNNKVFFVGVGSSVAVQEFANQLEIDPTLTIPATLREARAQGIGSDPTGRSIPDQVAEVLRVLGAV